VLTPSLKEMTECIKKQLTFSFMRKQKVMVDFEGREITSDSRLLLMRQAYNALQWMVGIADRLLLYESISIFKIIITLKT
jgi:hypothetical protein